MYVPVCKLATQVYYHIRFIPSLQGLVEKQPQLAELQEGHQSRSAPLSSLTGRETGNLFSSSQLNVLEK